jgi:Zn-dependent peptidase ImmA (M78 family)/transcriptional regulator with XRE-family HTH domain
MSDVPIRPALIVWAREHRGLDQAELAEKLSIPVEDVIAMENGSKIPNLTFFKRLSSKLKIPGGSLLRQTPPDVPAMPADYRTLEGRPPEVGFETRLAVNFARTISENVRELVENELTNPVPRIPRLDRRRENAEESGEAERQRLGVTAVTQLGWRGNQAFRNWRTVIENAGTFVTIKNFPLGDCKGFTIYDHREAPIIVISKKERFDPARTFTLIHEYAHLLIREPGLSDHNDRNPVEAWCNQFAGAFLMPRDTIRQLIGAWPNEPQEWTLDEIRNWARRLKVSQQALAIRFEALGLAREGFYTRIKAQQGQVARLPEQDGGNYVNTQVNELGNRLTKTVLTAEQARRIQVAEAVEILALKPTHFDRVRRQIEDQDMRVGFG